MNSIASDLLFPAESTHFFPKMIITVHFMKESAQTKPENSGLSTLIAFCSANLRVHEIPSTTIP